ncbi:hypothetical protein STEG23_026260, partial [Scotinomys teguina]
HECHSKLWDSENNFQELILSCQHEASGLKRSLSRYECREDWSLVLSIYSGKLTTIVTPAPRDPTPFSGLLRVGETYQEGVKGMNILIPRCPGTPVGFPWMNKGVTAHDAHNVICTGGNYVKWKANVFSPESWCLFSGDVIQKARKIGTVGKIVMCWPTPRDEHMCIIVPVSTSVSVSVSVCPCPRVCDVDAESANQDLQNRLLNLESANLMQELQSINNKCIAKIGFVDNKYEYLMDRTLTLQSEAITTQTLCKEERLSLTDKIRSLESCVSEEHKRWYDSMKNLESLAREEVHSLEQTLCARLQALEETLCKHDKELNKQKGKTIKVVTSPNGSHPMAYPVIVNERPADDTHPEPYVTHTLQPISIRDFKNMKEAIVTYGIHSTYVKQMLNSWSTSNRIIPDDWHQLTSAVLEYSQQLQWKSWLREEARNLEQQAQDRCLGIKERTWKQGVLQTRTEVKHSHIPEYCRASQITPDINSWQCDASRDPCFSFFWTERTWSTQLP